MLDLLEIYYERVSFESFCCFCVFQQVSSFCCWQPPLSTQDEDENESVEEYTQVSVDDSKLEIDTLVGFSIATRTGQISVSAPARVRKHVVGT
jgi:hypothetical protein